MIRDIQFDISKADAVLSAIGIFIVAAMGGWSSAMTVLVILLGVDFVLGTLRSAVQGRLSSATSIKKTGIKLIFLWALTTFGSQLDCTFGSGSVIRDGAVVAFTVAQGTSILENAVPVAEAVGWEVPDLFKAALEQLASKGRKAS